VQQAQQNYKVAAALIGLLMALRGSAGAAAIVHPTPPNPLLSDGKPGPCDPRLGQPDYVGEVDVAGNPVAPASVPSARIPVPEEILVPVDGPRGHGGDGPVAALDGRALDPLVNPAPNCAAKPH
jgi:hypothetical protein